MTTQAIVHQSNFTMKQNSIQELTDEQLEKIFEDWFNAQLDYHDERTKPASYCSNPKCNARYQKILGHCSLRCLISEIIHNTFFRE